MLSLLSTPEELRPGFPFPYPGHQRGPLLEEYVHRNLESQADEFADAGDWTYVPVYWTSYAACRPRVRSWKRLLGHPWDRQLNRFLRQNLRPGVKYFTVSQHDDGLRQRGRCVLPYPILELSAGGTGDIPLPLLCDPHPMSDRPRDIRASFLGLLKDTPIPYPCREGMVRALAGRSEYLVRHVGNDWGSNDPGLLARKQREFAETLGRSVFALCPRGYGKTSFRMYEALQLGAIPVYIYDEPWLPYTDVLDWNEFAVLVPLAEVDRLHELLAAHTAADIRRKQDRIRELYPTYFTFSGVVRQIPRILRQPTAAASVRQSA